MELIITLLVAFPVGYLVRQRVAAYLAYVAVHSFVFPFQTLTLTMAWVGGDRSAFGEPNAVPWDYAVVNLVVYAAGLGLVTLGHWLRNRCRSAAVDLAA